MGKDPLLESSPKPASGATTSNRTQGVFLNPVVHVHTIYYDIIDAIKKQGKVLTIYFQIS